MDERRIKFKVNRKKIKESILLIKNASPNLLWWEVCEVFKKADLSHLNLHGRPITGDEYVRLGNKVYPKRMTKISQVDLEVLSNRPFNPNLLSKSDQDQLLLALKNHQKGEGPSVTVPTAEVSWESLIFNGEIIEYFRENGWNIVI